MKKKLVFVAGALVLFTALVAAQGVGVIGPVKPASQGGMAGTPFVDAPSILTHPTLSVGLMAFWTFDGTSTTFAAHDARYIGFDSVGNYDLDKNGTGCGSYPEGPGFCWRGPCASCASSTNYLKLTTTDFRMAGDYSISAWVRDTQLTADRVKIFRADSDYSLRTDSFTAQCELASIWDSVTLVEATTSGCAPSFSNSFIHILAVYTASDRTVRLYRNGQTPTSGTVANGLRQASTFIAVGANSSGGGLFVDDLGVWNRALTADERRDLWNGGWGLAYAPGGRGLVQKYF